MPRRSKGNSKLILMINRNILKEKRRSSIKKRRTKKEIEDERKFLEEIQNFK